MHLANDAIVIRGRNEVGLMESETVFDDGSIGDRRFAR